MAILVTDPLLEKRVKAEREATGADRYDEVWEGVTVMPPLPNDEHQDLVCEFSVVLHNRITKRRLGKVRPGVNVSDRDQDWTQNYRAPDVVVFLEGGAAENRGSYWLGGPDFAVEIISEGDRAREKLPFYSKVNVRELLVVDRFPWGLELYRWRDGELQLVDRATEANGLVLTSEVVDLTFRLVRGPGRPAIEATPVDGGPPEYI